jgi:hypothetical protein
MGIGDRIRWSLVPYNYCCSKSADLISRTESRFTNNYNIIASRVFPFRALSAHNKYIANVENAFQTHNTVYTATDAVVTAHRPAEVHCKSILFASIHPRRRSQVETCQVVLRCSSSRENNLQVYH